MPFNKTYYSFMTILNCSQCKASLSCQADNINQCWCNELPAILPLNEAATACLCRNCTITKINAFLAKLYQQPLEQQLCFAKSFSESKNLIEEIDYTVENNNMVFSRWFFLKRGYCCSNGCRHCPYSNNR